MAGPVTSVVGGAKQVGASREEMKPKKRHVTGLRIKRGDKGGHVIEHEYDQSGMGAYEPPAQHIFGKDEGDKALAHIAKHGGFRTGKGEKTAGQKDAPAEDAKAAGHAATPSKKAPKHAPAPKDNVRAGKLREPVSTSGSEPADADED